MENLHYEITINAPKQKVWDTMLNKDTFLTWTEVFNPGGNSYFEGDWSQGSTMKFLGPEKDGTVSGMYGTIETNKPLEEVNIVYIGEINKGVEKVWEPINGQRGQEKYTFKDAPDGGTIVFVDLVLPTAMKDMFKDTWPKALEIVKTLAEK